MSALPRGTAWGPIRLRRDGLPPLRFHGLRVAAHDAADNATLAAGPAPVAMWHSLALYRRAEGGCAVEIVARTPSGPARCHATATATVGAALALLEGHDAAADCDPDLILQGVAFDAPGLPPLLLALQARLLHCLRHDVEQRYKGAVGTLLAGLGRMQLGLQP